MSKSQRPSKPSQKSKAEELFIRAEQQEAKGKLRSAFSLYLAGAKAGESGCQLNVGNYYDDGTGVRRNRKAALYWYKRAYRRGMASAAHNIGIVWRNDNNPKRALKWFQKAVRLGDDEANLEIAKYHLQRQHNPAKAIRHLEKVLRSNWVSEAGLEEARKLIKQAKKETKRS
jgi:TPR repeat protein